jgi:hypothetical protein
MQRSPTSATGQAATSREGQLLCRFLDAGNKVAPQAHWPASKKRQGTKSREVRHRRSSECYEVLDLGKFEE